MYSRRRRRKFRRGKQLSPKTELTQATFISRSKARHRNKYDYSKTKYKNNDTEVSIHCKKCKYIFNVLPIKHINGNKCIWCRRSKGEMKTKKYLDSCGIKFTIEHKLPDSLYRYDFYIESLGILIEYDGEQHFKLVGKRGARKRLLDTQRRDKEKDKLAALYGLPLIRIPYTELNNLEVYLEHKLSRIYKYVINKVYYRTFHDMCKALKLPADTTVRNYKEKIKHR